MGVGLGCSIEIVPWSIRKCAVVILAVDLSTSQTLWVFVLFHHLLLQSNS